MKGLFKLASTGLFGSFAGYQLYSKNFSAAEN